MNNFFRIWFIFAFVSLLAACQSMPQNEGVPATVAEVIGQIKNDLSVYQDYDAKVASIAPLNNSCNGVIGFYVESVKVSLTTSTNDTITSSGAATLPVGSGIFGASLGKISEIKGTQNLTFMLYPKTEVNPVSGQGTIKKISADDFPIAASLQRLRDGLLAASDSKPCVSLIPPADDKGKITDPGGTFVFGFTVSKQSTIGANIKLVIFSLGSTSTNQTQAGNTIAILYKARDGSSGLH